MYVNMCVVADGQAYVGILNVGLICTVSIYISLNTKDDLVHNKKDYKDNSIFLKFHGTKYSFFLLRHFFHLKVHSTHLKV